jgi:hypothetical protein
MKCVQTTGAVQRNRAGKLGMVLLCLAIMVGCQGFSSGNSASVQSQSGTLSLSGGSLDFGSVTAGTSKTLSMTVSNTGAGSVTVTSVSISTQYFALTAPSLPVAILAGQSTPVSLVFSPNAAGAFNATVSIVSNASNSGTATFSLTGTGVASGQITLSPASKSFGSVTVGSQSSQTVTLTNNSASTVNISQAAVSGTGFKLSGITTPLALNASQSTTFTVTFAPQATGSASGNVTITSDAPNPSLSMALTGTGAALGALGANPTSLNFGTVQTGTNQALSETVTNTGGSTVTISQVGISGTGFTLSGISGSVTLTAGQSTSFTVTFTPQTAGSASGSVTVTSNGTNPTLTVPLAGTGSTTAGLLTATPIAVGSVVAGTSGTASGSLSASGANVTVTAATSSNSRFAISGLSLPVIVPAGQSAPFTVTYSPLVAGADSATLTFTSNAQPTTTTDTATGTGTAAPVHTVSLSWSASTSPNISGYNIYRAVYVSSCGGYSKINGATLDTLTTYTDSAVTNGTNYCYATTAVDSTNAESGYSNIVSDVQIP